MPVRLDGIRTRHDRMTLRQQEGNEHVLRSGSLPRARNAETALSRSLFQARVQGRVRKRGDDEKKRDVLLCGVGRVPVKGPFMQTVLINCINLIGCIFDRY
jgi:hypothetical protein